MTQSSFRRRQILKQGTSLLLIIVAAVALWLLSSSGVRENKRVSTPARDSVESGSANTEQSVTDVKDAVGKTSALQLVTPASKKATQHLTLVPTSGTAEVLVVDAQGKVRHAWPLDAERARLLPDCRLLVIHGSKWGLKNEPWNQIKNSLRIYSWEGELEWVHEADEWVHHDAIMDSDEAAWFIERVHIPYPDDFPARPEDDDAYIRSDVIKRVNMQGKLLWQWKPHEHLDLRSCGWKPCEAVLEDQETFKNVRDWSHTNTIRLIPENKWFDQGDQRFKPGNVITLLRSFWESYVLDRETGEPLWSYSAEEGQQEFGRLIRGHDMYMIEKGYPGAGNFLILDNGLEGQRPYSIVREVDPSTKQTVWHYKDPKRFFTRGAGSAQRLKSGNTLVSQDLQGRVFEVTPDGDVVWEVRSKVRVNRAERLEGHQCEQLRSLVVTP